MAILRTEGRRRPGDCGYSRFPVDNELPVERAVEKPANWLWILGAGDFDAHRGGYLGVQPDLDLVRPRGLDRVRDEDLPAVDLGPAGGAHGLGDVARADRAEQAAVRAGAPLEPD